MQLINNEKSLNIKNSKELDYIVEDELVTSTETFNQNTITNKQKIPLYLNTFEDEFVTQFPFSRYKESINHLSKNKNIEIDALVDGPYVDEETIDSPFDFNYQPNLKATLKQKHKIMSQNELEEEIIQYNLNLLKNKQKNNENEFVIFLKFI